MKFDRPKLNFDRPKHKAWTGSAPWTLGLRIIATAIFLAVFISVLTACGAAVSESEQNRGREPEWGTGTNLSCEVVG